MVKKKKAYTLHFVNIKVGKRVTTASQHRKKSVALKRLKGFKKKGIKGKIVSKKARWVY
jgi:hypothetical protein